MKAQALLEEFDRCEAMAREVWSQEQAVGVVQQLRAAALLYIRQRPKDRWRRPAPPLRIVVDSKTQWG